MSESSFRAAKSTDASVFGVETVFTERIRSALSQLPGAPASHHVKQLNELFSTSDSDPSPAEVFAAYTGEAPPEDSERVVGAFDPENDNAPSTSQVQILDAYESALDAEMDESAAYLRSLSPLDTQQAFARYLSKNHLKE